MTVLKTRRPGSLTRKALDSLLRQIQSRKAKGLTVTKRDEQAALRLGQALELLEGAGNGGF